MIWFIIALTITVISYFIARKFEWETEGIKALLNVSFGVMAMAGGIISVILGTIALLANLPITVETTTIKYEETYNTLTTLLKEDKINVKILSEQIIDYNTKVKSYQLHIDDPWIGWYYTPVTHDFETINLEDYLN